MKQDKKKIVGVVLALLLVALFAGCGSRKTISFPTPTPRGTKKPTATATPTEPKKLSGAGTEAALQPAGTYKKVYEALKTVWESDTYLYYYGIDFEESMDGVGMVTNTVGSAVASDDVTTGILSAAGAEYSETNVQVEGIDEADIIKTDGSCLYIFNADRNEIYIVKAKGGTMELAASVDVTEAGCGSGREMYLLENRLVLVTNDWCVEKYTEGVNYQGTGDRTKQVTSLLTYDISDKSAPKLLSVLKQDGSLVASRCTGGMVYLITSYGNMWSFYDIGVDESAFLAGEKETEEILCRYIPQAGEERIAADCIYIGSEPDSAEFLVLTAMSPKEPQKFSDIKSFMGGGGNCYVSGNYIYVGSSRWGTQEIPYERTEVYRFAYGEGLITPAGQVTVKGTLNNQFSMDEYNGYLRVVTTVNEFYSTDSYNWFSGNESNALYIYDKELQLTGSIEDLAPGEHIESARLMGDIGYFVTFRRTDPLFSVDLSNPAKPEVLGELKIPGFSEYLHPYGENLLLGIGYDADETSGRTTGLKLSMFDVSDPADVKEVHKIVLDKFSLTAVSYNHKAALIDTEKNIIGIPARGYDNGEYNVYLVFGYDKETGFYQKLSEGYALSWENERYYEAGFKYMFISSDCRGVYIGDVLYLINPAYEVRAYDMGSWEQIGRVGLVKSMEERRELLDLIEKKNPVPIMIELEENSVTGYSWVVTVEGSAVTHSRTENVLVPPEGTEPLSGAPVTLRHIFEVNDIGKAKLTFEYIRIWDDEHPLRTIVYEVKVGEDLEALIESVTEY